VRVGAPSRLHGEGHAVGQGQDHGLGAGDRAVRVHLEQLQYVAVSGIVLGALIFAPSRKGISVVLPEWSMKDGRQHLPCSGSTRV